jgi:RimJ/RimL family protein N-acetyltransferase
MTYAFETLGFTTVVWRISPENIRSREAIVRIGATLNGSNPTATGESSMLLYTMRRAEWPTAKARLSERLAKG